MDSEPPISTSTLDQFAQKVREAVRIFPVLEAINLGFVLVGQNPEFGFGYHNLERGSVICTCPGDIFIADQELKVFSYF
jgi:hypothetical protein